jgi:enolase-phosphatase E1
LPDPTIRAVLTDIEGTTTPIAFVHDVLFPFARATMADFLATHAQQPGVAAELEAVQAAAPGQLPLTTLLAWMDQDAKATPLKTLQGMIWQQGYQDGRLKGVLYPDVAPALHAWHAAGLALYVYSSGSVAAQRLIFGHSTAGDLTPLFTGYFDTHTGGKREPASYRDIAAQIALPPGAILFLSDVEAELAAADAAGLRVTQMVRAEDGTTASTRYPTASSFTAIL